MFVNRIAPLEKQAGNIYAVLTLMNTCNTEGRMFRKYSRITAAIVMCFFTWTSGGVFGLAHAAQLEARKPKAAPVQKQKPASVEERFSKVTEELEGTLADIKVDSGRKKTRLKAGRDEIDKLDVEMRAQFAATEQKLKAAKLPAKILERHAKFVKHYDDNLNELKGNIARVEKAKDQAEIEVEIEKIHKHLKRVKAPSSHQKLDPNNLAHRSRTLQKREPRMKKEDFDKDLKKDKRAWRNQKRIQVASMGSLAGLLTSSSFNAVTLPTSDDLAETIDVQLTPEIRAKALELGNNPVRIYEWVRNNIDYVPTWGSIQGANMTMQTKQGNAFDTSSLLIALLRAAGIHARYNIGTIELPIDKVMNWVGGFTDPMSALDFMSSGGVPTTGITEGGIIKRARLEHVWVEAFINYIPSRGAKHVNGKGETWIKLDPSYKSHIFGNNASFYSDTEVTTTTDSIHDDFALIVPKVFEYLLGTRPYRTEVIGNTFSIIPDTYRHKLTFNVKKVGPDSTPLAITKSLPELAGKKITISYSPASADDEAAINAQLPQPHADGTIALNEFPTSIEGYLINVVPELRIDEQIVASGSAVPLGTIELFTMQFYEPNVDNNLIDNIITAGTYKAVGLNLGKISYAQIGNIATKLNAAKTKLNNNDFTGLSNDSLLGELLFDTALTYHSNVTSMNKIPADTNGVKAIVLPSVTLFSTRLKINHTFGEPESIGSGGLYMDADRLLYVVKPMDGNSDKVRTFMLTTSKSASMLEHLVPEQIFSTPDKPVEAISTVKALQIAYNQGIPVYEINKTNINEILTNLSLSQEVITDIQNAVNAGKVVTAMQRNIVNYNGWTGCGYIITDPETGAGGYMISDGLNGAAVLQDMDSTLPIITEQWKKVIGFWDNCWNHILSCSNPETDKDCPCGYWTGFGLVGGLSVPKSETLDFAGSGSIIRYTCVSRPQYDCEVKQLCADIAYGQGRPFNVGLVGCHIRDQYTVDENEYSMPNFFSAQIGPVGFSYNPYNGSFCSSVGIGGYGLSFNMSCRTTGLICVDRSDVPPDYYGYGIDWASHLH